MWFVILPALVTWLALVAAEALCGAALELLVGPRLFTGGCPSRELPTVCTGQPQQAWRATPQQLLPSAQRLSTSTSVITSTSTSKEQSIFLSLTPAPPVATSRPEGKGQGRTCSVNLEYDTRSRSADAAATPAAQAAAWSCREAIDRSRSCREARTLADRSCSPANSAASAPASHAPARSASLSIARAAGPRQDQRLRCGAQAEWRSGQNVAAGRERWRGAERSWRASGYSIRDTTRLSLPIYFLSFLPPVPGWG